VHGRPTLREKRLPARVVGCTTAVSARRYRGRAQLLSAAGVRKKPCAQLRAIASVVALYGIELCESLRLPYAPRRASGRTNRNGSG
jgi:hypothetical protein